MLTATGDLAHGVLAVHPSAPLYAPLPEGPHWLDTPVSPDLLYVPSASRSSPRPWWSPFRGPQVSRATWPRCSGARQHDMGLFSARRPSIAARGRHHHWTVRDGRDERPVRHGRSFRARLHRRARIAVSEFPDGDSYALGLGLANGDLFTRVLAHSPGSVPGAGRKGRPALFLSHGRADVVHPIAEASHRIVPALKDEGYHLDYVEHPLGHQVPATW